MRPRLPGLARAQAATVLLAGADEAQVAAWSIALEQALERMRQDGAAPALPPVNVLGLLDANAADLAGARHALLIACASGARPAAAEERLRRQLTAAGVPYAVVPPLPQGLERALSALRAGLAEPAAGPRWRWVCADCDDGDCEAHVGATAGTAPAKA